MLWGWAGGIAFFLGNMWWLSYVTWPGMFALVAYLALFWGFAAMLARGLGLLDMKRPLLGALLAGVFWTSLDWMRGSYSMFGAHGLPWLYLGDTQTPWLGVCQIADVTGVYGVTFLLVFVNAILAACWVQRAAGRGLLLPLSATAAMLIAVEIYGQFRLRQDVLFPGPTVMVVQPNYPQSNTGDKGAYPDEIVGFHVRETQTALELCEKRGEKVDLVVWSETMMPPLNPESRNFLRGTPWGNFYENTSQQIANLAARFETNFLVGSTYANDYHWVGDSEQTRPMPTDHRNSAYLYNEAGLLSPERYDKIQLLPFGEYIPFHESIPWLYRLLVSLGPEDMKSYELTAGEADALTVFSIDHQTPGHEASYRFVVPICFEDIVAPLVTDQMRSRFGEIGSVSASGKRADFVVNVTNDGWFGGGERAQHLQAAVFRSIENRAPTARSVNTGVSGFIDSLGRTTNLLRENTEGWSVHQLMLDHRRALHTRIGELFAECCATVSGLIIVGRLALARRLGRR